MTCDLILLDVRGNCKPPSPIPPTPSPIPPDPTPFQVLDEADRLLESSFETDLEVIFDALPQKRQTLLFSATLTDTLSRLKEVALNQPFYWEAPAE